MGIGLACRKRTRDEVDFFLGGRRLGSLVAAISASASSSSAWTLLGVSGAAYAWGLSAVWLFPSCVGGFLLNWFLLAPALGRLSRREDSVTVTELLAGRPGSPLRSPINLLCSLIVLASLGTYVAAQFQGAGKTFSETFDISLTGAILIGSAIVVLYTLLGGFWAVSITDTLQGLLMAAASCLLPLFAIAAVGGAGGLTSGMAAVADESFLSLGRNLPAASAVGFVLGLLGIGLGYPGQPHVVNRFMAMDDRPGVMNRARIIAVSWAVVVYAGMLAVGWCGRVLMPGLADPEVVFIALTHQLFHPVVSGVILAAVLSAIMSTADSQLLVAASTVTRDLGIGRSRFSALGRSRLVVLVLSAGAAGAALLGSQEIFSRVLFAWAAMGAAFGPVLLVVTLKGEVRPKAKLLSIVAGAFISVGCFYLLAPANPWKGTFERVASFFAALAVALWGLRRSGARTA